MPRTAVTLAKTHDGKWKLLSDPGVPLTEQLKSYRALLGSKSHEEYCLVQIQESDGHARILHLLTPAKGKAHNELRAKETKAALDAGKAEAVNKRNIEQQIADDRAKGHRADIEAIEAMATGKRTGAKVEEPEKAPVQPPNLPPILEGLRLDGPTIEEFIAAGFKAEAYPPKGFHPKPLPPVPAVTS